jgi:hypothetical protein
LSLHQPHALSVAVPARRREAETLPKSVRCKRRPPSTGIQVTAPTISASVGNRPSVCLEQATRSSMRISKMPPPDRCSVTCASGRTLRMRFAASRARGS